LAGRKHEHHIVTEFKPGLELPEFRGKPGELMGSYGCAYDFYIEKYMRDYKIIQMALGGVQRDILDVAQGLYGPFKWSGMDEWIKEGGLVTEGFGGARY